MPREGPHVPGRAPGGTDLPVPTRMVPHRPRCETELRFCPQHKYIFSPPPPLLLYSDSINDVILSHSGAREPFGCRNLEERLGKNGNGSAGSLQA